MDELARSIWERGQALLQQSWRLFGEAEQQLQACRAAAERLEASFHTSPHITLARAILVAHHCQARCLRSTPVKIVEGTREVWSGTVHEFQLFHHPQAETCYAWTELVQERWHSSTLLKLPPVGSAEDAVRFLRFAVQAGPQINACK